MDNRKIMQAGLIRKATVAWLNGLNALRDSDAQGAQDAMIALDKIDPHKELIEVVWELLEVDELLEQLEAEASRLVI